MNLTVLRKTFTKASTTGELLVEGQHQAFTLEPPAGPDLVKPRAIPEGMYELTLRFSPKHAMIVPHVEGVPGFDEIELHIGNYPHDTIGCCLLGQTCGPQPDFIGQSGAAFQELMKILDAAAQPSDQPDVRLVGTITYKRADAVVSPPELWGEA